MPRPHLGLQPLPRHQPPRPPNQPLRALALHRQTVSAAPTARFALGPNLETAARAEAGAVAQPPTADLAVSPHLAPAPLPVTTSLLIPNAEVMARPARALVSVTAVRRAGTAVTLLATAVLGARAALVSARWNLATSRLMDSAGAMARRARDPLGMATAAQLAGTVASLLPTATRNKVVKQHLVTALQALVVYKLPHPSKHKL